MDTEPGAGSGAVADGRNGSSSHSGSGRGRGAEGSSSTSRTLADVMREPSTSVPDIVVLDSLPETGGRKDVLDPKEDLWLSTVDG